jgi:hypothetical protein
MLVLLIDKVLLMLMFAAVLVTARHAYYFIRAYVSSTEEDPVNYRLTERSLGLLCLSISYILSVIFTGFAL